MSVKQRLIEFLKYKNIGQKKFAQSVGVSDGYVNAIRVSIQPNTIHKITIQYPELNTGWLLTGNGEMLNNVEKSGISSDGKDSETPVYVPLLPISAQGGKLKDFIVSANDVSYERVLSPIKDVDFAITVVGDSMSPEYPSGSQILIKKINEHAFIDWGKVYVLDTCNGSITKKILPTDDKNPQKMKCVSINPEYPSFDVSMDNVLGIYRVLLCMSVK